MSNISGLPPLHKTVRVRREQWQFIEDQAKKRLVHTDQVLMQLLANEQWLREQVDNGCKLLIENPDHKIYEVPLP